MASCREYVNQPVYRMKGLKGANNQLLLPTMSLAKASLDQTTHGFLGWSLGGRCPFFFLRFCLSSFLRKNPHQAGGRDDLWWRVTGREHNRRHWILNGKFAVSRSWTQLPTFSSEPEMSKLSCQEIVCRWGESTSWLVFPESGREGFLQKKRCH